MRYFGNRRPQGFHHTFLYVDERRDMLADLERRARASVDEEQGSAAGSSVAGAQTSAGAENRLYEAFRTNAHRRHEDRRNRRALMFRVALLFCLLMLLVLLVLLCG